MNPFTAALEFLKLAVGAAPARVPSNAKLAWCLPTIDDLRHLLANDSATLAANLGDYLTEVGERWARADAQGLLHMLRADNPDATDSLGIATPSGLRGVSFKRPQMRMSFADRPVDLAIGLVQQSVPGAVSALMVDEPTLLQGLAELRRLDDLLVRVLASRAVADDLDVTVGEVLALYRTEGNLGVPRSARSLDHGVPPMLPDASEFEPSSLGRTDGGTDPNISHLVLLENPLNANLANDLAARELGVAWWMIQLVGLDALARLAEQSNWRTAFADLSMATRNAHPGQPVVTVAQRRTAWDTLVADMQVRRVARNADGALVANAWNASVPAGEFFIRMAPADPEQLVAAALTEGVLLQRFLASPQRITDSLLPVPTPAPAGRSPAAWIVAHHLAYAQYNLQVGYRGRFIMSAISHAIRDVRGPSMHQPLRDEVRDHPVWGTTHDETLDVAEKVHAAAGKVQLDKLLSDHGPALAAWLLDGARGRWRLEQIDRFIANANLLSWPSWNKVSGPVRGNAHRHHLAVTYYHRLTGESPLF